MNDKKLRFFNQIQKFEKYNVTVTVDSMRALMATECGWAEANTAKLLADLCSEGLIKYETQS